MVCKVVCELGKLVCKMVCWRVYWMVGKVVSVFNSEGMQQGPPSKGIATRRGAVWLPWRLEITLPPKKGHCE